MKYPKIANAAIIGIAACCVGELVSFLLKTAGYGEYDMWQIDSTIIVNNQYNYLLGLIVSVLIGAVMGMLYYIIQEWIGHQQLIVGGVFFALLFWFLIKIYSSAFITGRTLEQRTLAAYYNHLISTVFTGLFLGIVMKKILRKKKPLSEQ